MARYAYINIASRHLKHFTAAREHFSDEKLYCLDIKIVIVVNNRRVRHVWTFLFPVNKACFKFFFLTPMITLVLQSAGNLDLSMSL